MPTAPQEFIALVYPEGFELRCGAASAPHRGDTGEFEMEIAAEARQITDHA